MSGEQSLHDVEQFWSASAATFDESADHGLTDPEVRAAWHSRLVSWMPDGVASVADLGCGTGSLSLLAAELLATELGSSVVGIDLSPAMIQIANEKVANMAALAGADIAGTGTVRFEVGDASDPAIEKNSIDVVMTRHLLWTLPDPAAALQRWTSLLKPTGRAILIEGVWGKPVAADDPVRDTFPWSGGVPAVTLVEQISTLFEDVTHVPLSSDDALWGKSVSDERYVVIAQNPIR